MVELTLGGVIGMKSLVLVAMCLCAALPVHATLTSLITNGDFETGTVAGWTSTTQQFGNAPGSCDDAFAAQSTAAGCATGTAVAFGTYAAYSSTSFPGGGSGTLEWDNYLSQNFTVPAVVYGGTFSFEWTATYGGNGSFQGVNVLAEIFQGATLLGQFGGVVNPNSAGSVPWTLSTNDISSVLTAHAGQTLTLELLSISFPPTTANTATLNTGFDNVDIEADVTPEPATVWLAAAGVMMLLVGSQVRRYRAAA